MNSVHDFNGEISRYFKQLTVNEWIVVADCPVQRNTRRHAEKSIKKHLKTRSRTQSLVAAALLNNQLIKLDGHTRSFCWQNNWLNRPESNQVDVAVYPCKSIDEVINLYYEFDGQSQGKDCRDKTDSAFKECYFAPNSGLVKDGSLTYALQMATGKNSSNFDFRIHLVEWLPVLKLIDNANFTRSRFPAAIFAACLITVRIFGEIAMIFWCSYYQDAGEKREGACDGVQALSELLLKRKAKDMVGGRNCSKAILGCSLHCFECWRKEKWLKQSPRCIDLKLYMQNNPYPLRDAKTMSQKKLLEVALHEN